MIIRTATHEYLDTIVAIYNQAIMAGQQTANTETFSVSERVSWFKHHETGQHPVCVALQQFTKNHKMVIGYLSLSEYHSGRQALMKTAEVSYYIHLQHHGKGIGTGLLRNKLLPFTKNRNSNCCTIRL
ncbi:hypothetical protein MNBD_GAMMA11-2113 [hydrothermal vent metagenome]|uniref:N-acetyltransferase domain-containing protein n=1 Tax=hydrothermal vent metagenome TaxID=652676 RepID=A0A3B0XPG1_9ZZZZ